MKRLFGILLLSVLILACAAACGEVQISFSPEHPRVGDYVDVTVTADREGAQTVTWSLVTADGAIFDGKPVDRFTASFRPRVEKDHTLTVTVSWGKKGKEKDEETASVLIPVSGEAPVQQGSNVIYSQRDGWWADKVYSAKHHRSVQKAGCALFALSHALQRKGHMGEDVLPDHLAATYSYCYVEGRGTANETLLNNAAQVYDFYTESDLIESEEELTTCFRLGDVFSFSIVNGHIACAESLSEDGTKVRVIDSAPSATFERMKGGKIYYQAEDGSFAEARTADELPGIRWFFETQEYGGMAYWLDLKYCAGRGMRLIRPWWLKLETGDGLRSVSPDYIGAVWSRVNAGEEEMRVRTADLRWTHADTDGSRIAMVTNRKTYLTDGDGKTVSGFLAIQPGTLLTVLREEKERLYVFYKISRKQAFGYVKKANVELLEVSSDPVPEGIVATSKGKTAGNVTINVVRAISGATKNQKTGEWVIGTPIALLEHRDGAWYAEGKGLRGWIDDQYVIEISEDTQEGHESDGTQINEGK